MHDFEERKKSYEWDRERRQRDLMDTGRLAYLPPSFLKRSISIKAVLCVGIISLSVIFLFLFTPFHNSQGSPVQEMGMIYELKQKIQDQKKRVCRIIEHRKELSQLSKENRYYLPHYIEIQNEEKWQRKIYERLIKKYNQLMNINYSLLGGNPLAATLHIKNDLPN